MNIHIKGRSFQDFCSMHVENRSVNEANVNDKLYIPESLTQDIVHETQKKITDEYERIN